MVQDEDVAASDSGWDPDRVAELFAEALERHAPERRAWLDARCAGFPALRAEIDSLLAAHEEERSAGYPEQIDRAQGAELLASLPDPDSGRRIGPWRLLRELGRGGMGIVHLAERAGGDFRQQVAIKLIKRGMDSDAILQRFLQERRILAGLDHPNVARLLDGGVTEDGQPWFAMELVEGEPLTAWCEARRSGLPDRLRLLEEACRAVHHAHTQLVVHRDLKPTNMLVTTDGRLKLLDFGVAKLLAADDASPGVTLKGTELQPWTPQYAAPEQVRGQPVTTATDVHALGLILFELMAGRPPYGTPGASRQELERAIVETDAGNLSTVSSVPVPRSLRSDLDAVAHKALRKEPERRYASAEAFAEDIRRCLSGQPVLARPDRLRYRASKFVSRHRLGVGVAMAAVLSLVAGLAGTAWQAAVAAGERDRARLEAARAEQMTEFLVGLFKASDPARGQGHDPTARDLLDRGTERIQKELADQPLLKAELLHAMARSFQTLGHFDRARQVETESLSLLRAIDGGGQEPIARGLDLLGVILYGVGDLAAAEETCREAVALRRRLLPGSKELAESLSGCATVLIRRAKLQEAEPLAREALTISEDRLGTEDLYTIRSVLSLADLLHAKGQYEEAAELHRRVLSARRNALGDRHPDVARALTSLGITLQAMGDAREAEAAHREALRIRREVLGEDHPHVASSYHHLGTALLNLGDLRGAEASFRSGLQLDRKLGGDDQSNVANGLTNLAQVLMERARFDEAGSLLDQALAIHGRVTEADHPMLAHTLEKQASWLIAQGRANGALPAMDKALAIFRRRYGDGHPRTAVAIAKLAEARAALGDFGEAEALFRSALEIHTSARPGPHLSKVLALIGLGEVLHQEGRDGEAEPRLREALDQARASLPGTHWRLGDIESRVGACLVRMGRAEEGRSLQRAGEAHLREALGDGHPRVTRGRM